MEGRLRAFLRHLDSLEAAAGTEDCFAKEFQSIKKNPSLGSDVPELSTQAGKLRENLKKNRYKDILPFDQTRVPLTLLTEDGYSDYINANFIRGVDGRPTYIATQGPLGNTVVDLWRMIWEFHVTVVVMACREVELGKRKCERYWATEQEPATFGPFTISNVGEEALGSEVIIRTLSVDLLGEARTVLQFQYLAWPDHGIPGNVDGLLGMIERVHQGWDEAGGPVCIHCSAGCGRTGVICTVDYIRNLLLNQLVSEEFAVLDIVREMRCQRPAAVQTKDQYHFVYRIVAEMFRRRLHAQSPEYQNWREAEHPQPEEKQLPVSKPLPLPKPRSLPRLQPQPAGTMSGTGSAADTYAVVSRPRSALGPPPAPAARRGGDTEYENLQEGPPPPSAGGQHCIYSSVLPGEGVRQTAAPPVHVRSHRGAPAGDVGLSYSVMAFPRGAEPRPPDQHMDGTGEEWAPSLPQRTADSFLVDNQDLSRVSSFSSSDGTTSGQIRNVLKMTFPGTPAKKAPDSEETIDDGYEDIGDLTRTTGLGFNARVPKPKGPRDPPSEWAQYGR